MDGSKPNRTDAVCESVALGGIIGFATPFVSALFTALSTGGLDGTVLMWVCETSGPWYPAGAMIGAVAGGLAASAKPTGRSRSWALNPPIGGALGMLAGEWLRLAYDRGADWHAWPGGCGMLAGSLTAFLMAVVSPPQRVP